MKYIKVRDVKSPTRAHETDAGIDFYVPEDFPRTVVGHLASVNIPSGIKVDVPRGYALVAFNKSGIATKKQLLAGACVVDSGYRGEVHLHLINVSSHSQVINPGDKILQFILMPVSLANPEEVSDFDSTETDRGENGFGSTG